MNAVQEALSTLSEEARGRLISAKAARSSVPSGRGMRDTSRAARQQAEASGKAATQYEQAYSLLRRATRPLTRAEIAAGCGYRHSSACSVVFDLLEDGIAVETPRQLCTVTGSQAHGVQLP